MHLRLISAFSRVHRSKRAFSASLTGTGIFIAPLEAFAEDQPEPTVIQTRGALRDLSLRPRIQSREGRRYRSGPKADVPRHGRLVFRFTSARPPHLPPPSRI